MQKDTESGNGVGYELRDVDVRALFRPVIGLVVVTAATFVLMYWLFGLLAWREAFYDPPPASAVPRGEELPPEPRLQMSPPADLAKMRAEEQDVLGSYEVLDEEKGVVRVPIERAVELTLERGLPVRRSAGKGEGR